MTPLSVRYGGYGGYRFSKEDIGISILISYRFFNVISVSYICINISMNPVSVRYGRYGGYRYRFGIDMGDIGISNPVFSWVSFSNILKAYNKC